MKKPPELLLREWVAISIVIGLILISVLVSKASHVSAIKALKSIESKRPKAIEIRLIGAIKGEEYKIECAPGKTLREVLKNVELTKAADRKKIPYKRIILSSQTIEIPQKEKIKKSLTSKKRREFSLEGEQK